MVRTSLYNIILISILSLLFLQCQVVSRSAMAKGRGSNYWRNKSRGTEADEEVNVAQEQSTAPMSGLNGVRALVAYAPTGIWQQVAEMVATEGKRKQLEDLGVVMQTLETRKYPDFEHEKCKILAPDLTH